MIGPKRLLSLVNKLAKYSNITEICRREDGVGLDSTKIKVTVDDKDVYVDEGVNLIQACQLAGVEIPHFCYHKRLAIAGNCRMCLVEVEKVPKPVVSCAMPASPNMRVFTNTPMVKRAREGVMEFLLANHPLDCPICDQGGECDLQDQAMSYGADRSRMHEMKRAVEDKNFGPLVKTSMNRCIHCTRCVRFMNEVAGVDDLGTTGRGHMMQISTYLEKTLGSEVSGNIIDLCPVGALTSKPHAFKFRPWELKSTNSVDCMDGLGSAIRIDSRGKVVMRILPLENDSINEEWLSDKARFSCDGLAVQRIMNVCIKEGNQLTQIDWKKGLSLVAQKIHAAKGEEIFAFSGVFTDVETLVTMKDFMIKLGSTNIYLDRCYWHGHEPFPKLDKQNYIFNSSIAGIDRADQILLIGTNPKKEAPLLNCRIRKRWLESNATIFSIGLPEETNLTYDYTNLGSTLTNHSVGEFFKYNNKESKFPMIIVGSNVFGNKNASSIMSIINNQIAPSIPNLNTKNWNGMNMLHYDSSTVGALDVGWTFVRPKELTKDTKCKVLFLLGADSKIPLDLIDSDTFVVYIGHSGDVGAEYAHLILPGQAYTEKNAIYVNTEGRVQRTTQAVPGPGDSREDWSIIRAMAELCSVTLNYSSKEELYERIYLEYPHLVTNFGELPKTNSTLSSSFNEAILSKFDYSYQLPIDDYYMTDCISRSSKTMAACSKEFYKQTTTSPIK